MKSIPVIVFLFLLFTACNNQKSQPEETISFKPESEGISIVTRLYKNSTTAVEYEIPVVKGTDIKHGIQKRYYQHGSLYSEIPYIAGKREGTAYTYYPVTKNEKPIVWKEQPYINDNLEGICKRYHRNGKLQAEYEYKNGLPALGLKEFHPSGNPVKFPDLILNKTLTNENFFITARLTDGSKNVKYYIGDLVEGKYLPENLKGLQVVNGTGEILVPLDSKKVTITAVIFTEYENQFIVSKSISL
jgi:hypothetical protein